MKPYLKAIAFAFVFLLLSYSGCKKEEKLPIEPTKLSLIDAYNIDTATLVKYQSALPGFTTLYNFYPQYGPHLLNGGVTDAHFSEMVGGYYKLNVDSGIFQNSCASRVSYVLNKSGEHIPYMKDTTSSGENGYKYIFRVQGLKTYLENTYGPAQIIDTNITSFLGYKGIIIFETGSLWSDASGHATLWNLEQPLGGNYVEDPHFYFKHSECVSLWVAN